MMSNKVNGVCVDERGHAYLVADGWENKEGRRPLYTTDHAEELAKALDTLICEAKNWDIQLHAEFSCGQPYIEDEDLTNAIQILNNYREATK